MKFCREKYAIIIKISHSLLTQENIKKKLAFQLKFSHFSNANIPVELPFHAFTYFIWMKQIAGNKKKLRVRTKNDVKILGQNGQNPDY